MQWDRCSGFMAFIRPTSTYFAGGAPGGLFPLQQQQKKKTDCLHQTAVAATFSYAKTTVHYSKIWPRTNVKVRNKQMLLRNRREGHKERIYSGFVVCRCTRCIAGICGQQTAVYDWPRKIMARCVFTGSLRWEVQGGFVLPSQESVSVQSWEVQFKIIQRPSQSTSKQPEQCLQLSNLQTTILEWKRQQR